MAMRRMKIAVLPVLVVALATACGESVSVSGHQQQTGDLQAEVVYFEPGARLAEPIEAVSDRPIDMNSFLGSQSDGSSAAKPGIEARPGTSYVAVAAPDGPHGARTAKLVRDGDNLIVRFVGGRSSDATNDCVGCTPPHLLFEGPVVQFAVSADAVRGVQTINGRQAR